MNTNNFLKIFDWKMENYIVVKNFISSTWKIQLDDAGSCEVIIDPTDREVIDFCLNQPYLFVEQNNNPWLQMRVTARTDIMAYKFIKEGFSLKGFHSNDLLRIRTLPAMSLNQGDSIDSTVGRQISNAFSNVEEFEYVPHSNLVLSNPFLTDKRELANSAIKDLLGKQPGMGIHLWWDVLNKKIKCEFFKGKSGDNEELRVFSQFDGTLLNCSFAQYDNDYYNAGYYTTTIDDEPVEVKIESQETDKLFEWERVLSGKTSTEAQQDLNKYKKVSEISGELPRNVEFMVDYELGDEIVMKRKIGSNVITSKQRVIGVGISFTDSGKTEKPEFEEVV